MITTKSDRVLRDLDLLAEMAKQRLVGVMVSITSLTPAIARTLEPRAPAPRKRLAAVRALAAAGIPTWVSIAPVIPAITDHEIEHLVEAAAKPARTTARSYRSDCRSKSRLCSVPGSTNIIRTGRRK